MSSPPEPGAARLLRGACLVALTGSAASDGTAVAALVVAGLAWLALGRRRATIATRPRT